MHFDSANTNVSKSNDENSNMLGKEMNEDCNDIHMKNTQVMRDITSLLKQRKLDNVIWNTSKDKNLNSEHSGGYNNTDNQIISSSSAKSNEGIRRDRDRDNTVIVFEKSINIQVGTEKDLSQCTKEIESNSISQKKDSPDNEDYNKENSNRNEYDNDLDRYLDFKTPEKGCGICKNLALESFSKYLEL